MKKVSNISRTLIINSYEGFYYKKIGKNNTLKEILKIYSNNNLLRIVKSLAKIIKVEILNESTHDFKPFGSSASLLVQSNLENNNGVLHLKESHITFHTYIEDILENFYVIRLEIHICSCSDEDVFNVLPHIFSEEHNNLKINSHLILIDYLKRGTAFDLAGNILVEQRKLDNSIFKKSFGKKYIKIIPNDHKNHQQYGIYMMKKFIHEKLNSYSVSPIPQSEILKYDNFLIKGYLNDNFKINNLEEADCTG